MKIFYKEQKVRNGYIAAFVLLMISYFLVFFVLWQMEKRVMLVNKTSEKINNLDILLSCVNESENVFKGFIIMQDSGLLDSYRNHNHCAESSFQTLKKLLEVDDAQLKYLDTLYTRVSANVSLSDSTLSELNGAKAQEQNIKTRLARQSANVKEIRRIVFEMQTNETKQLASSSTEFETTSNTLKIVHLTTFIIALLLLIYSVLVFNNVSKEKLLYREQLEDGFKKLKTANNDLINLRSIEKFAASGRIARAIAHEIRNPLTSISLATEQLESTLVEEEEKSMLEIINRGINRIHLLIQELLNSTKFSHLTLDTVSLNTLVHEVIDLAKDRIDLNAIKTVVNLDTQPCIIKADREKIKVALLNVVVNSIEAVEPEKGIIEITTQQNDGKCIVSIKDNGSGMDDNELSRIFEPFYTLKENGNGLGLTLTQNIVLNHKGDITVESKPNNGTLFTMVFNSNE